MARNRGKKALYEVMSTARSKSGFGRTPEQTVPERSVEDAPPARAGPEATAPKDAAKWWRKPRIVQLNAGRIEFSMPYQIAVAAGLVLVFALLASYRIGQSSAQDGPQGPSGSPVQRAETPELTSRAANEIPRPPAPAQRTPEPERVEPAVSTGDNVIVLVQYHTMADLGPVQAHFAAHDIETEIVPENGRYLLQTKQRYESTTTPGSDGYKAKQKIGQVGALYKGKAPPGYETFAPHYFSDAYGKKIK
ncbi:MAG: hypothetical protein JSW66_17185 [Phycisphaerales bacterium]|nr:MAG: hypothetical protein JSW66_17185 [Phycisphaerales bacterium]